MIVYIVTDGLENSSREWTTSRVKDLVERQKNKYGWRFLFLGANMDAVSEGISLGIDKDASLTWSSDRVGAAYSLASAYTSNVRTGKRAAFSAQDRRRAMGGP